MNQPSTEPKAFICEACGRTFVPKRRTDKRVQKTCDVKCAGRLGGMRRHAKDASG